MSVQNPEYAGKMTPSGTNSPPVVVSTHW